MRRLLPLALLLSLAAAPVQAGSLKKELGRVHSALGSGNVSKLISSLRAVTAQNDRAAAKGLIKLLPMAPQDKPELYWPVIESLSSMTNAKALDAIASYLLKSPDEPQAKDILFSLQNNRSPEVLRIYRKVLKKRHHPLAQMACDRVGELETPEAVDLLIEILKKEERSKSRLARRISSTLAALFGGDRGDSSDWETWWESNRETALKKGRRSSNTGTVKDELGAARAGGLTSSTRGGKVLVLKGMVKNFDQIEEMLTALEVRHSVLLKADFMNDMNKALKGVAALILNCNFYGSVCRCPTCKPGVNPKSRLPKCTGCNKHDLKSDMLSDEAIKRIKRFVKEGGSVFTEDWGLKELTGRAWPKYIAAGRELREQVVDYAPVPGQTGSPLLRGVMARKGGGGETVLRGSRKAIWKIDNLSPAIKVPDKDKVTVLLASKKLGSAGNADQAAVALTFSPGEEQETKVRKRGKRRKRSRRSSRSRRGGKAQVQPGLVLHVLSHFGKQKSKEDEFTLQNLLVNFLLEAKERKRAALAAR